MSDERDDLTRRFVTELDRLPVPAAPPVPRRRARSGLRDAALVAGVIVAVVAIWAALPGLVPLVARPNPPAGISLPAYRASPDLVYVADGTPAANSVAAVSMPDGARAGSADGAGYVGSEYAGDVVATTPDVAFFPRTTPAGSSGEWHTTLHGVDLHSGRETRTIDAGGFTFHAFLKSAETLVSGPPTGQVAVSPDASVVYLVRDTGESGATTEVDAFDARSGARVATRTFAATHPSSLTWSTIVPLDASRVLVLRRSLEGSGVVAQDWLFLGPDLATVARLDAPADVATSTCAPEEAGAHVLVVCSDPGRFEDSIVFFLDPATYAVRARVTLERVLGYVIGATVAGPDGQLVLLTDRPLVARIDTAHPALLEARLVTGRPRSLLDDLREGGVALAKGASGARVRFSPDGRFAYAIGVQGTWWEGIALIDLERATVVAQLPPGDVATSLALSRDGGRLYALVTDAAYRTASVLLLDPGTLSIVARSAPLPRPAPAGGVFAVVGVADRR